MADFKISRELAEKAFSSRRFSVLGTIGTDLSTIGTWDERLPRRTRILVPIDVQAYVVPEDPAAAGLDVEPVVALRGRAEDPAPFSAGAALPPGIHLHWAMPDALLSGGHDRSSGTLAMPRLPDRWVVVRALQPVGRRQALTTGWVIDAAAGSVTPLASFAGTPSAPPPDTALLEPLDGTSGGPVWTATYAASVGRFGFQDSLKDLDSLKTLAPEGFAGDQAVYTVAGWWSVQAQDPLSSARGSTGLDSALAALGWHVTHDEDDVATSSPDPRIAKLAKSLGLSAPAQEAPARVVGSDGRIIASSLTGVSFEAAYPVRAVEKVWYGEVLPTYDSLLHGSVLGVPIAGTIPRADDRPPADALSLAVGSDVDDVVAAFSATATAWDDRRAAEDLVAAFSNGTVSQLGSTDGLDDLAQREHESGFWSLPGTPVEAARSDRLRTEDTLATGPMTVGRKGRAGGAEARVAALLEAQLSWDRTFDLEEGGGITKKALRRRRIAETTSPAATAQESRAVNRPAPRFFRPQPTLLAVRGAHPSHRHHGDGLFDDSGRLLCRYPAGAVDRLDSVVDGATVVPSLGSGAIPGEVLTVVRESVLLNPYAYAWLVAAGAPAPEMSAAVELRVQAEMVRLYGASGTYDGRSHIAFATSKAAGTSAWDASSVSMVALDKASAAALARFSVLRGTPPSPVALTTWRQPWVPLWVEWRLTLTGTDSLRGWHLDGNDLEPEEVVDGVPLETGAPVTTTLTGRSLLGQGVGESLRQAVSAWLSSEQQRHATPGRSAYGSVATLQDLGNLGAPLDLVSASLDGVREQLLGIDYVGQVSRGGDGKPTASGAATTLFGGLATVDAVRLVDAFGRTLDVPDAALDALRRTTELEVADVPRAVRMRPRLQGSARWLWRLVDPAQPRGTAAAELNEAFVDQIDPSAAVNPVAGFLLPDHIDEGLETFTTGGDAIGQIGHDAVSSAVTWEPAPGRAVPPDAGPLVDLEPGSRIVGEIAAGIVRSDAAARALTAPPADSALVALLRAVDTTLWTVDTYAALGAGTLAGLVGRPIAVVRTMLRLDTPDDLEEVTVTATGGVEGRANAFARLSSEQVQLRLGCLTRTDDALLGYFVDDDYEHLHLVDKVVASGALHTGRHIGQLGLLGSTLAPDVQALDHPYLVTGGTLTVRPGQTVMLTLLMLPHGRAHLTSGVLPRKDLALADSWVTPGLKRLVPSVRVGPVLVDPAEIRLPLISVLSDKQTFTRRTGELTWRDDPILASTQTAYLPRLPHEVQEGWVRVTPDAEPGRGGGS